MAEYEEGFPTLVYKDGGDHQREGGTFSYKGVNDPDALKSALSDGWFKSLPEAVSGESVADEPIDEVSPPTRDEAKAKADELGIEYAGNIPTKKLIKLIEEKLAD